MPIFEILIAILLVSALADVLMSIPKGGFDLRGFK